MTTETLTAPELAEASPAWPPVQHIIHNKDSPPKEGTIALCGVKLMGIDLGRMRDARGKLCEKCVEEFKKYVERQRI